MVTHKYPLFTINISTIRYSPYRDGLITLLDRVVYLDVCRRSVAFSRGSSSSPSSVADVLCLVFG